MATTPKKSTLLRKKFNSNVCSSRKSFMNALASWIVPFVFGMVVSQMLVTSKYLNIDNLKMTPCVDLENNNEKINNEIKSKKNDDNNKATVGNVVVAEDDDDQNDDDKNEGEEESDGGGDHNYDGVELEKNFDSNSSNSNNNNNNNNNNNKRQDFVYVPASTEEYIMNHFEDLGYNVADWEVAEACPIWQKPEVSTQENFDNLQAFRRELDEYTKKVNEFVDTNSKNNSTVPNFVKTMRKGGHSIDQRELCKAARLHPAGMEGLFPSKQLSLTPAGYVEPLLTPMRHPAYCDSRDRNVILSMDYLIHDFEQMCLDLKPSSTSVLIDMGASLQFHRKRRRVPILQFLDRFEQFGFQFDHIYGFEITEVNPGEFYNDVLPEKYIPSFHWINTGKHVYVCVSVSVSVCCMYVMVSLFRHFIPF